MKENALKGKWVGGTVPLGYALTPDKRLKVNEQAAKSVRLIFKRYNQGISEKKIIEELNNLGYRTAKNKLFSNGSLSRILSNKRYTGYYNFLDVEKKGVIEPIITQEDYLLAQERVEKQKKGERIRTKNNDFVLTGRLFCGECGEHYVGTWGTGRNGKHYYYRCVHKCNSKLIPKDKLEDFVYQKTVDLLDDPKVISDIASAVIDHSQVRNYDAEATEQQIKDLEKRIANLTETLEITVTKSIVLKIKELETELEKSKVLLKKEQLKSSPVVLTREQIMYFLQYAIQTPYKEKLISLMVKTVLLFKNKTVIEYSYSPSKAGIALRSRRFAYDKGWWGYAECKQTIYYTPTSFILTLNTSFWKENSVKRVSY